MNIGGLQKTTLIDYPGKMAATIFLSGCNFKCHFCYSGELVLPAKIKNHPLIPDKEVFKFLKERKGLLEGIVICGGEPTINKDLKKFIKKIKKMGYLVKLDTNGSNPLMLEDLINKGLIDYVAMDIKAPKDKYAKTIGKRIKITDVQKSVDLLKEGKVDYEFRTTVTPKLLNRKDILKIAQWLSGAKKYYLQGFRSEKTIDPKFEGIKPYSDKYIIDIVKAISPFFDTCQMR